MSAGPALYDSWPHPRPTVAVDPRLAKIVASTLVRLRREGIEDVDAVASKIAWCVWDWLAEGDE